jgi:hypothetical protein
MKDSVTCLGENGVSVERNAHGEGVRVGVPIGALSVRKTACRRRSLFLDVSRSFLSVQNVLRIWRRLIGTKRTPATALRCTSRPSAGHADSLDGPGRRAIIARTQFSMLTMTIFGCLSVLLAATRLYGLMSFSVKQRVHEIGIRMALGAGARHIRGMLLLEGLRLALVGVGIGVASALALARLLTSALFGVTARDPFTVAVVPALLVAVALVAVWVPARRATRVDPFVALRAE